MSRADRPAPLRPVSPSAARPRPPMRRSGAFDRDSARAAWRHVARTRGAGPGLALHRASRRWPVWVGAIAIAAAAAWSVMPRSSSDAQGDGSTETAVAIATPVASPTATALATDPPAIGESNDRPAPPAAAAPGEPIPAPVKPHAIRPRLATAEEQRSVPAGTPREIADAYRNLPRARGDGEPLGAIGTDGLHVDQLSVGARLSAGNCEGDAQRFRVGRNRSVHACIRLVHRRIAQQILVRWERDGRLVRRQWLAVPSLHAYRTRATLPVKRNFGGNWTVRVLSLDGAELASRSFTIGT